MWTRQFSTKICEIEARSSFENVPLLTKIGEIEAHSSFENGKRTLALAHALRGSHSGGSLWVEQTRHFFFVFQESIDRAIETSRQSLSLNVTVHSISFSAAQAA